jgi:hypothetical protein
MLNREFFGNSHGCISFLVLLELNRDTPPFCLLHDTSYTTRYSARISYRFAYGWICAIVVAAVDGVAEWRLGLAPKWMAKIEKRG